MIQIGCGRNSNSTTDQYLRTWDGIPMNTVGIALLFNSTLVGISMFEAVNTQSWTAQIRKNGSSTDITTLSLTNAYEKHTSSVNVDFDAGDRVQVRLSGSSIDYPQVILYFRRRK